jgi:uncharacterized protein YbaR (Trm112 family)
MTDIREKCLFKGKTMPNTKPQLLVIENQNQREIAPAMCSLCHGRIWHDFRLSEEEHRTVLVCESCGVAFNLIPIVK